MTNLSNCLNKLKKGEGEKASSANEKSLKNLKEKLNEIKFKLKL